MDNRKISVYWESIRFLLGALILFYFKDWFGLNNFIKYGNYLIITYLMLSFIMTIYFVIFEFQETKR